MCQAGKGVSEVLLVYAQLIAHILHGPGWQELLSGGHTHLLQTGGMTGQPATEGGGTHAGRHGNLILESCFHNVYIRGLKMDG